MKSNQYSFFCIPICFLISSAFFYHHLCMASYSPAPLGIHKHPQNVKVKQVVKETSMMSSEITQMEASQ